MFLLLFKTIQLHFSNLSQLVFLRNSQNIMATKILAMHILPKPTKLLYQSLVAMCFLNLFSLSKNLIYDLSVIICMVSNTQLMLFNPILKHYFQHLT